MMVNSFVQQKRRFRTRLRETVKTNPVLPKSDAKRILSQKRRFGTRFRETHFVSKNVVLALALEKLSSLRQFSHKMM